jgi:protein involved in polysaccharide export with SLBB domain
MYLLSKALLEIKQSEQLTILQAVAQADGFSERAAKTKVKVVRQTRTRRKKPSR